MNNLVFSNFLHRPARTIVSILGIAIGVLLIVFTVGLANGSMRERANREGNLNAEIFVCPKGQICMTGRGSFLFSEEQAEELQKIEGVHKAIPIGQKSVSTSGSRSGERLTDGIIFDEYQSVVNIKIVEGRKFETEGDEIIVDTGFQNHNGIKIGDTLDLWERQFKIVGTYEPAAGARVKIPLLTMQKQLGGENKATGFLVKIEKGFTEEQVAENISKTFDGRVFLTKDLEDIYMNAIPALDVFLNVVIGIAAIISALVILLTMYTTVTERTRQIGIMKSLGMSNAKIAWTITQEALLITFCGIIVGILFTLLLRFLLSFVTNLQIEVKPDIVIMTFVVGLLGGAIGGLYPALRAAKLDAVEALNYE